MLLKDWIPFRLMLFSQSKFQLKNLSRKMLNCKINKIFLILMMRIRLGGDSQHFTENQSMYL